MVFPGVMVATNHGGQIAQEGMVKALQKTITLRMIGSCPSLLDL